MMGLIGFSIARYSVACPKLKGRRNGFKGKQRIALKVFPMTENGTQSGTQMCVIMIHPRIRCYNKAGNKGLHTIKMIGMALALI